MNFDWGFFWSILPDLLRGLKVTVEATVLGSVLALVLGLAIAIVRRFANRAGKLAVDTLTEFVRRTPLLIQLYVLFYALPNIGLTLSAMTCGVLGLGIQYGVYAAETYRGGIESVETGQWEAAHALSLPATATWSRVVLPQALIPVTPALGNLTIAMFKDSALLSTITVVELMAEARQVGAQTFAYVEPFTAAALLYLVVSLAAGVLVRLVEGRLGRQHEHRPATS
jgi:polar amino acid transport system permease protein